MNRSLFITLILIILGQLTYGQSSTTGSSVVSTAVPFLTIAPDSRAGALGDAGVATSPDINSQHWNPAKYAFIESSSGIALSYTPWMAQYISDMNLAYLTGYHKIDKLQTISASLCYFDLGEMQFYDANGNEGTSSQPNEFSVDFGYTLKLSDNWSGSVAMRYIRSDIFSGVGTTTTGSASDMEAGNSFAADVSFFYTKTFIKHRKESNLSCGVNISNIGKKITYDDGENIDFLPTNFRIGAAYTKEVDKYNKFSFTLDLNKLLVPYPEWEYDEDGNIIFTNQGMSSDAGPIEGIFISLYDDPGGFVDELKDFTISAGAEYWYSEQFALRTGYFNEAEENGNRKYLTFGAGLKMNVFSLDFSYIYTVGANSALENTIRFTLGLDIENFQKQGNNGKKRRR